MSDNAADPTVTGSSAPAGVNAEMQQTIQKIVMGIFKEAVPRMIQKSLQDSMPALLDKIAEDASKNAPTADAGAGNDAVEGKDGRVSLKALQTQVNELSQQLKQSREEIATKEQQRVDALMRGEVREGLAGALGADNPNLPLVMDSLYDARKRFVRGEDGQTYVRFKSEYGADDDHVPLKDGIKKLVDGELKHMLPAKTSGLPGVRARNGQPIQPNGNNAGKSVLDDIFANVAAQAAAAGSTQK